MVWDIITMTVDFNDYFWGEKNNGYDVLYHNMKYGLVASKELSEFFRERSNIEENYSKLLNKLAKQASSCCVNGTFAPLWHVLKSTSERLSSLHMQMVQKVCELVKDVNKYADEVHKKHKLVKEDESGTLEAVQAIQSTTVMVHKAKDLYTQKGLELDRLRKENASAKDIEKAEAKLKKAHEDYKTFVDKYSVIKDDFEKKMSITCRHFQQIEEAHLIQMKEFLQTYAEVVQTNHDLVGQVHSEFRRQCIEMTVDKLLETFVLSKYTGLEKPGMIEVDDLKGESQQQHHPQVEAAAIATATTTTAAAAATTTATDKSERDQPQGEDAQSTDGTAVVPANEGNPSALTHTKPSKREGNQQSQIHDQGQAHGHDITGMPVPAKQTWSPPPPTQATATKPSRRTTSLLNLFMSNTNPQGSKEYGGECPSSAPSSPSIPPGLVIGDTQCHEAHITRNPLRGSKWFLRSRRDKAKLKKSKTKKKEHIDNVSNKEEKSDIDEKEESVKTAVVATNAETMPSDETVQVDEDGFCIRPKPSQVWTNDKNSFYSSSDSESDDEREQKIRVEIKPLNNGSAPMSASVDELRATVENLSLSPMGALLDRRGSNHDGHGQDASMKRSQSVSQQLGSKVGGDLLGLVHSPVASNASTPTSSHPYAPLQSPTLSSSSRYADLGDLFSDSLSQSRQTSTPTPTGTSTTSGYMSIPRPPSRRSEGPSPRGRVSPSTISRADSVGSLEFRTACVPVGVSRGPSPLTIGMADTIPLAVAFHEIVHSYFRGSDETKCQVKMSGDMMLSFPAGIVTVLANNPNPAKLVFRVRNTQRLNSILPNKQLVSIDAVQSGSDNLVLEFNMTSLSALLKRQSEQNPGASYFNVDILKYQVKAKPGANSCPFQLVAYWKCEPVHTDLKIDYKYNSHAMSSPSPLLNVTVAVPVDGGVRSMQSKPVSQWLPGGSGSGSGSGSSGNDPGRVLWKFTELSQHSDNFGVGSMRARFDLDLGPGQPATISTQFNCEGTTLSGIDFQLVGAGYRLSLVKRRFISGKYICDGDATATPQPQPHDC